MLHGAKRLNVTANGTVVQGAVDESLGKDVETDVVREARRAAGQVATQVKVTNCVATQTKQPREGGAPQSPL